MREASQIQSRLDVGDSPSNTAHTPSTEMASTTTTTTRAAAAGGVTARTMRPSRLLPARTASSTTRVVTCMVGRKVITNDKDWAKGLGSVGIFLEEKETKSYNLIERLAKRKVLSSVEQSGLLSAAEKAGLTLSKVESLKLLSTAEKLGVLSLLESAFAKDGATITSYSIPFFLGALGALVLIPNDNAALTFVHYGTTGVFLVLFTTLFAGGFVIKGLQEDD